MSDKKFKTIGVAYRKPRNIITKAFYVLKTGNLVTERPHEDRISRLIAEAEEECYALHRRSEDSLNRKTLLTFVPLQFVLEDRLQNAEIPFRRKITPRTFLVWFYAILFMFLPWDLDDFEMVPDERKISALILHRAERGYELARREDDPLNLKTLLKFRRRNGTE